MGPGIKLRLSGLATSACTHCTISQKSVFKCLWRAGPGISADCFSSVYLEQVFALSCSGIWSYPDSVLMKPWKPENMPDNIHKQGILFIRHTRMEK